MRFIEGETLQSAIDRYHRATSTSSESSRAEFRKLLQHYIDVCNAIEYAHSRHVIHRDRKPEDVMLGSYGETYVVDWGLARECGVLEDPRHSLSGGPECYDGEQKSEDYAEYGNQFLKRWEMSELLS